HMEEESLSLFHFGKELFDTFGLSLESEITFSDCCKDQIFVYRDKIKFTSMSLIFFHPKDGWEKYSSDDWIETESLDFYPWHSVLNFQNIKGEKILQEFGHIEINKWLSTKKDPELDYPYIDVRRGHIGFIVIGRPKSVRSRGGRLRLKKEVAAKKKEIARIYPQPFSRDVEMSVDIFLEDVDSDDRPDVDRLSSLIMDAFEGVAYTNDKQIKDLRPRIIDVSQAFTKLECRTHPMDCFSIDDIPTGSVFPLAMGIKNYYVVRISYYN
ncbi:RusA family crossover junction endodeoxyribonuclease, partial [bacterium]|nr:RusA family crossover junction endodeoxyribonuclease [bacterium]